MSFDLTNKNIKDTFQNLLQKTGSDGRLYDLVGNQVRDLTIDGTLTANTYVTSESIVNTSSGSTAFGNSSDDTHDFSGSVEISGSGLGTNFKVSNGIAVFGTPQLAGNPSKPIKQIDFIGENDTISFISDTNYDYFNLEDSTRIRFGGGFGPYSHDQEIFHDTVTSRLVLADNIAGVAGSGIELRAHKNIVLSGSVTASGGISASGDLFANRGTFANPITSPSIGSNETAIFTVDDNLKVNGNITASGDISSSGTITVNDITASGNTQLSGSLIVGKKDTPGSYNNHGSEVYFYSDGADGYMRWHETAADGHGMLVLQTNTVLGFGASSADNA